MQLFPQIQTANSSPPDPSAATCKTLLRLEEVIEQNVGKTLASRPYWTFLLELYLAEREGRTLFQSCLSTAEPPSSAHRRAGRLADLGAVVRTPDRLDHRRVDLMLTQEVKDSIARAIHDAVDLHRDLWLMLEPHRQINQPRVGELDASLSDAPTAEPSRIQKVSLLAGGRVLLPVTMRRSLNLHQGDSLLVELVDDEIRIRSARMTLRKTRQRLRSHLPNIGLVSDRLIAERRAEAARA